MKKDELEARKRYNVVGEHYVNWRSKLNPKGWIYNEHLEMPTTFKLLGNIKGKRVLDFGCGAGIYAKKLTGKGAKVKGFDISPVMLKLAKEKNPKLDLRLGSGYKIPFKEKFDVVVAPLVIGYLENWDKVFKEVSRILKKRGYFIFSIGNPVTEVAIKIDWDKPYERMFGNYFKENKIYSYWRNILHKKKVKDIKMHTYHKTYETLIKTILKNNFEIVDYKDCFPLKKSKRLFPKEYAFVSRVPFFCVWKVRKK
ncbi:MAG: class I SAM-dependent methyltransferase [archaeon]